MSKTRKILREKKTADINRTEQSEFPSNRMDLERRLDLMRNFLETGKAHTQEDLKNYLAKEGFSITQSTISRSLKKMGAIKLFNENGEIVYRLSEPTKRPIPTAFHELIYRIVTNGALIVIHTAVGSASLVARHLDQHKPGEILGTLAGDDTIFVCPKDTKNTKETIAAIWKSFENIE